MYSKTNYAKLVSLFYFFSVLFWRRKSYQTESWLVDPPLSPLPASPRSLRVLFCSCCFFSFYVLRSSFLLFVFFPSILCFARFVRAFFIGKWLCELRLALCTEQPSQRVAAAASHSALHSLHPSAECTLHSLHPCTAHTPAQRCKPPLLQKKKLKIRTFFLPNCIFTFHSGKTLSHSTRNYKNTFCKTFSNSANLLRKNEDIIATNRRVSQANPKQLAVVEDRLHR